MNKLNNNEALQMNTVMPTMKKSLLALAVAGTMAMSGGAYATAGDVTSIVVPEGTESSGTITAATGADTYAVTGTSLVYTDGSANAGAGQADTVKVTDTGTTTNLTITVVDASVGEDETVTALGAIVTGDGTTDDDQVDIASGDTTDVVLTIGAVTGTGTLGILGENAGGNKAIVVTAGADIGTDSASLAGIEITAGDHQDEDATLIITTGEPVYSNILLTDGTAGTAALTLGTAGGTVAVTGNITSALDSTGLLTIADTSTVTGNIGTGIVAGTTAFKTVTINDGEALTVTGTVNVDTMNLSSSTGTGTNAVTFKNTTTIGDLAMGDDNATSTNNITFDTSTQAYTATIALSNGDSDASDTNTITIDGGSIAAAGSANLLTYASVIHADDEIDNIVIGSITTAGNALFNAAVTATNITLDGGDTADEASSVEFQGAVTATAILLDKNTADSTMTVNATNGAVTVAGTIDGVTAGDGILAVIDDDADGAPNVVTFSGAIGASQNVGQLNVGNTTQAGNALFTNATPVEVVAITVTGGDHADEDSLIQFNDAITATSVTLNDGLGDASITINATNGAQTIAGTFDGAASGEGTLNVSDDDAGEEHLITFSGIVGGTQRLKAINIGTGVLSGAADFDADVTVSTLTILGGDANTEDALLTNATLQTLDATTMVVTADDGDAIATLGGDLAIGSGGLDINGGSAEASAKVTVAEESLTLSSGAVTIDGGVALATGGTNGGTAELETTLAVSATGAFTVTGGNGALTSGAGVGGAATLDTDAAFTTTKLVTFAGGAGGAGTTDTSTGGAATGEFATTIDVLGLVLNGGAGGAGAVSVGGAATATVTTTSTIGASGISMTAGSGGAYAGAAVGGASTLILTGASTITGDIAITGGAGVANDAADGGVASATFTGAATATAQTLSITGGTGSVTGDGDGGAASATLAATSTFSGIVLDDGLTTASQGTGGAATLTLTSTLDQTITGAVTAAADGEGAIVVATGVNDKITTFASNIGTSAVRLKTLNVTSVSEKSSEGNFNGDVYVDAITLTGHDANGEVDAFFAKNAGFTTLTLDKVGGDEATATFDGTTAQTITGSILGAVAGDGAISVTNTAGTVTFASALGATKLGSVTLAASTTTVFDSTLSSATLSASGAMTLKGAVTLTGILTTGADSTITLGSAFKDGSAPAITAAGSTTGLNQTANTVTVNVSNQFTTGTVTLLENTDALDAADAASFKVTDTALVDYTLARSNGVVANSKLNVTASKRTTAGIATYLGMSTAQSAALGQISAAVASGDATASTALDTVLVTGGSTAVNAAEQLNSDAGAAMGAAMAVTGGVNNVIAGRQANTKIAFNTQGKQSGVSTGDASNDAVVWAQVFTSDATQDKVDNIDGYDADSQGLVVGWEAEKAGSTFGLSLSFADTDVDGKSAAAAHIDTSSVQGTIYGSNGSTDWMMGYASADNDTTRTINFGGLTTRTATGNYASNILMAKAGYSFDSIEMAGGVATLTPKADLSWTHINNDGYTETGASNLNLIVDSTSNDVVTARAGMEFAQRIENNGSVTIPRVSIMGGYDLNNDRAETTSTFTGGGSSFTTQGIDPSNASLELGVGVDHVSDDTTVSFNFNTNLKDGYNSDTASLTLKSKF